MHAEEDVGTSADKKNCALYRVMHTLSNHKAKPVRSCKAEKTMASSPQSQIHAALMMANCDFYFNHDNSGEGSFPLVLKVFGETTLICHVLSVWMTQFVLHTKRDDRASKLLGDRRALHFLSSAACHEMLSHN